MSKQLHGGDRFRGGRRTPSAFLRGSFLAMWFTGPTRLTLKRRRNNDMQYSNCSVGDSVTLCLCLSPVFLFLQTLPTQRVSKQRKDAQKPSSAFLMANKASSPEVVSHPSPHQSAQLWTILGHNPSSWWTCHHRSLQSINLSFPDSVGDSLSSLSGT